MLSAEVVTDPRFDTPANRLRRIVISDRAQDKFIGGSRVWENNNRELTYTEQVYRLAYRCLHIAFAWNDHNFEEAHIRARNEAKRLGINNFEEAGKWLEQETRLQSVK